MVLIEGNHLSKKFISKGKETDALKDVSFILKEGEVLGIVGESGSGKSTLLKVISGIIPPDKGELFYRGNDYTGKTPRQTGEFLQYIFQNPAGSFDPKLSMEKSVLESGRGTKDMEKILEIMDEVGLDRELLKRRPAELSGGQCQRMSIARALYSKVGMLVCDEITSALDVSTQAQITALLQKLKSMQSLSLIFVSHDIALVRMLCDRVMVMKDGKCVEQGDTLEVIKNPKEDYTKLLIDSAMKQSI